MRYPALLLGLTLVAPVAARAQVQGMIIDPFETDSAVHGDAGQVVEFFEDRFRVELRLPDGVVEVQRYEGDIVPLDPVFTPAYVLSVLRACTARCREEDRSKSPSRTMLHLVRRTLEVFPDHPDVPELRAIECDLLRPLDAKEPGAAAIECAEGFARDHPEHPRADEMQWRAALLRDQVYEFEGQVALMKQQADAFEAFLAEHPDNRMRDEVIARIARLYYMMHDASPDGGPEREGYRARAAELYGRVVGSEDETIRLRAIIERFNLEHGRRIYVDPNAWTPYF